jgi:hypothetical protein
MIRPATEADMELLFGLILELAEYEKLADAVAGDPEAALRFYEKLGATQLGDWITHRLDVEGMRRLGRA